MKFVGGSADGQEHNINDDQKIFRMPSQAGKQYYISQAYAYTVPTITLETYTLRTIESEDNGKIGFMALETMPTKIAIDWLVTGYKK